MEEKIRFQSEVRFDLATSREFDRINAYTTRRTIFSGLLYLLCACYLFSSLKYSSTAKIVLAFSLFSLGFQTYLWFRSRDGGIQYKRILRDNEGNVPRTLITIDENGITNKNLDTEKERHLGFGDVRYLMESKRLLILADDLKIAYILDKSTLTGGSRDALVSHLRKNCPKMKKRVRKGIFGRVLSYLMLIITILMLLASIAVLTHVPEKLSGQLTNDIPVQEMVEELAALDIEISDRALDQILLWESDDTSLVPSYPSYSKVLELLSCEGMGSYDYDTWEWTPSTSGVYWFDLEVMDCTAIYANFLLGLDAMDDDLTFSNVTEDLSGVDMISGTGIVTFSFDYLGQSYTLNAQYEYDWFDTNMLAHLGRILQADADPKDLWCTLDGQGVLLYYGTEEEVLALEKKTGLNFLDPVNQALYSY